MAIFTHSVMINLFAISKDQGKGIWHDDPMTTSCLKGGFDLIYHYVSFVLFMKSFIPKRHNCKRNASYQLVWFDRVGEKGEELQVPVHDSSPYKTQKTMCMMTFWSKRCVKRLDWVLMMGWVVDFGRLTIAWWHHPYIVNSQWIKDDSDDTFFFSFPIAFGVLIVICKSRCQAIRKVWVFVRKN